MAGPSEALCAETRVRKDVEARANAIKILRFISSCKRHKLTDLKSIRQLQDQAVLIVGIIAVAMKKLISAFKQQRV